MKRNSFSWDSIICYPPPPDRSPLPSSRTARVDQPVDLPVGGLDAADDQCPLVIRAGGAELLMQIEHGLHQLHLAVEAGHVGGVGEVDG